MEVSPYTKPATHPTINKLCDWLGATTTYREPETPRTTKRPKWRLFYMHGPILREDAQGNIHLAKVSVNYNRNVEMGEIITSGNGRKYMVRNDGSLRRI